MKIKNYNPKAREAFGKSLIDIGVALFKSVMLLILIAPVTVIVKGAIEGESEQVSILNVLENMSEGTFVTLLILICLAIVAGVVFRKEGLTHIHESEN